MKQETTEDKYYIVKSYWGINMNKIFKTLKKAKNWISEDDEIFEVSLTGKSYTIESIRAHTIREGSLNAVLDGDDYKHFPNEHHRYILKLVKDYNIGWRYKIEHRNLFERADRVIDVEEMKQFLQTIKWTLLNFICKDVKDFEHALQVVNFRKLPDISKKRCGDTQLLNDNINLEAEKQFNTAKYNLKTKKKK